MISSVHVSNSLIPAIVKISMDFDISLQTYRMPAQRVLLEIKDGLSLG